VRNTALEPSGPEFKSCTVTYVLPGGELFTEALLCSKVAAVNLTDKSLTLVETHHER
jgi:hypothetical protein